MLYINLSQTKLITHNWVIWKRSLEQGHGRQQIDRRRYLRNFALAIYWLKIQMDNKCYPACVLNFYKPFGFFIYHWLKDGFEIKH